MIRHLRILLSCAILYLTAGLGWMLGGGARSVYHGGRWLAGKVTTKE
jgi:hypothetical protein